ncbi:MAG: DMT family transporter [Elusimicrobia bacterium]|nr:DMT family transporter [Elusimicrobiota bacterium]
MNIAPLAAIWLTVCINSFFPIFGWLAAGRIAPALYAFAGSAIGFACFLPWIARNGAFRTYFRPGLWPRLLAVGFFGSALPIALLVTALNYTTPANAAILCQVEAVYALVLAGVFLKEKVTPSQLAGTALVLAGTLLIALRERFTVRWTGDLMVLAVPLFYQISHLFSKKLPRDLSHVFVASARTLFASLGILPLVAFAALRPGALFTPSLELLGILLVFGVALTALNNVLWYRAILNMDLSKATAIVLSYPVLTALLSHAFGIERLHAYQAGGLLLALAGAWWVTLLVKKDAAVPA